VAVSHRRLDGAGFFALWLLDCWSVVLGSEMSGASTCETSYTSC
jgi:hypothetical protein